MAGTVRPDWIAVDWGTTHMRAYAIAHDGTVGAKAEGPGMAALAGSGAGGFETALLGAVADWLGRESTRVLMCGMVGSRQGWQEAPYLPLPADLRRLADGLVPVPTRERRLDVHVVPGLAQSTPPDVMRGEETQLAGYLHSGGAAPLVCLPGTHAKWARLEGSMVTGFFTAMTGEMFDLLSRQSILRHSVGESAMDEGAFREAVATSHRNPAALLSNLFAIRAEGLLCGENAARARGRLSGLLIGAELAAAAPAAGEAVAVIGAPALSRAYAMALETIGIEASEHHGDALVLDGLTAVQDHLSRRQEMRA